MVIYFFKSSKKYMRNPFLFFVSRLCRNCEHQHCGSYTFTPRLQNPRLQAPHPDASTSLLQPDILRPVWGPRANRHPLTPIHMG